VKTEGDLPMVRSCVEGPVGNSDGDPPQVRINYGDPKQVRNNDGDPTQIRNCDGSLHR